MRRIVKLLKRLLDNYSTDVLLKNIKPIDISNAEYIFILNPVHSKFAQKLYIVVSHELAVHGIPSCFLYKNDLLTPHYPRLEINGREISNSLVLQEKRYVKSLHEDRLFFDWNVEIENEKIATEGINFFPFIRNTLRVIQKRYNVFYTDDNKKPHYSDLIQSCDVLLKYFLLLKDYSRRHNTKIRLVGWEISYIPNGIFKMLCDQFSHNRDVEFIELERGYMNYFAQYHQKDSYISCFNLTKTKSPFGWVISKEDLAKTDETNIHHDDLLRPLSNVLEKSVYHKIPQNQKKLLRTMEDYRSRGKKVFVLFAHLFYDTPVDDESAGFNGMGDWINETVRYFYGKEDLLLIKPHPSELRKDFPKKNPNETLGSFLRHTELTQNTIILEPRLFTIKDLSPFISCGLIWRSSVAMELAFLGIPSIIAGNPYYTALDMSFAKDKEDYFHMIEQSHQIKITDKQKMNVAKYVYLLQKKHAYIDSISYDMKLKGFYWNRKALADYLKQGDPRIKSVVENMLV